jgi:prepilin-type N-terminal cleavage/methylation domain-containing protein
MKKVWKGKQNSKGFTLVELAIVLIILGFLVGMGASLVGPLTIRAKTTETKEIITADMESAIGFAATNNRIPDLGGTNNDFRRVVRTANDAWVRPIQYIFDNNLATSVCNRRTTNITLRICNNSACTAPTTVNNVAFIVLSPSANSNNQTAGSQAVGAALTISTYASGVAVDNYAGDFTRATDEYDDIIKWVTLPELQAKLSCGRCSAYEVWNNAAAAYFMVNGGGCAQIATNTLISSIGPGGSIRGYTNAACNVPLAPATISYTQIQTSSTDADLDCQVNYNNSDR